MAERKRIIEQWRHGAASVLITLVNAEGSSYRRPGARLLVGQDGRYAGSISGGCLEAEVVHKAEWIVRAGATVERYSTLFDDTAEIPYGLGCGGVVDLLLEPVQTAECRALLAAVEASLSGVEARVATWLPGQGRRLTRAIFAADGSVIFASEGLRAEEIEAACAAGDLSAGILENAGRIPAAERLYVERLTSPQRLFVLGAGEDAKPVVTMAALLGWRVTVADGRPQMARAERFPEAERVVVLQSLARFDPAELDMRAADAVVQMTHSYEQDRALLTALLTPLREVTVGKIPGYIGLLGASHRSSLLVAEAAAKLGVSVAECCARVWAPVGLDLGGDGAEVIALAIIAEVQAWREGRLAALRRLTAEKVAEHIAEGGASRYLQTQCALDQ